MKSYELPVSFEGLVRGKKLPRIAEDASIRNHIYTILMTSLREFRFDPSYGCNIWDSDFDIRIAQQDYTNEVAEALKSTIDDHEPRLRKGCKVNVKVAKTSDAEEADDIRKVKQSFVVQVQEMYIKKTNQPVEDLEYSIVFSPITLD